MPFGIVAVEAEQSASALAHVLLAPGQSPADVDRQVRWFVEYARRLHRDLARTWILTDGDRVLAACNCIPCPGRTTMLFITDGRMAESAPTQLAGLADQAVRSLDPKTTCLVQVLLHPDDQAGQEAMLRAGFRELATLLYMERQLTSAPARHVPTRPDEAWIAYDPRTHQAFADFIERTYQGSLDCRGLTGLRDINDVLEGHKAAAIFRPHRWRMLLRQDRPIACVLLGENPLRSVLEVVYMGVDPQFRGQGLGDRVVCEGLALADREGFSGVTLAVDAANLPAIGIYRKAGFQITLERRAMIRMIDPTPC